MLTEDRKVHMAENRFILFSLEFNTKIDEPELYVIRVSQRTTQGDDTSNMSGGGYGPDCEKAAQELEKVAIQNLWTTQTVLIKMDENRFWGKDSRLFEKTVRPVYKDHIF